MNGVTGNASTPSRRADCSSVLMPRPFQNVEAGVEVGDVEEPVRLHVDVAGMQDRLRRIRPRIHRAGRGRRHEVADLLRPVLVADVENPDARILVGREDNLRTLVRVRPVFPEIMWPEVSALGDVVLVGRDRHRRDGHRIDRRADVDHPRMLHRLGADVLHASSATTSRPRSTRGRAECVPPANGGLQFRCESSPASRDS